MDRIYLNNGWKFSECFHEEMVKSGYDDREFEEVRIPHTLKETPFNYFDEQIYQMVSVYRKEIDVPSAWENKKVLLTFEAIGHVSEVFINGVSVGTHGCGYTAFTIDLSDRLIYGKKNIIAVKVDSREEQNVPPFGFVIDYMTYGGIYRDVYLEVKNENYLRDVFLHSEIDFSHEVDVKLLSDIELSNAQNGIKIKQYIREKAGNENFKFIGEVKSGEKVVKTNWKLTNIRLWDTDNPNLYEIKTELIKDEKVLDEKIISFGFRKAEFLKDGFYLNNKKFKIRGLNRHQSYPYVGYAMPESMQRMDAEILKYELGLNAVRTSHYPQSHHFINRCDELGLLVFTEIPGWQFIGNSEWRAQAVKNTEDMVKEYRNHTSIILWGVRINESGDFDEFYRKTNEMAHKLDPYRQTGGVRANKKSSLLEDVYTYNDFSYGGSGRGCEPKKNITSDMSKPYMVTEYNGHMFPTKAYDCEEHRVEHAIRHANVLNAIAGEEDISGSFGWCMADYNTHKDFGSGDRICYHGVLDMFRNEKPAASVYSIQQDIRPVLTLSSSMDIGEHPECIRGDIWIFSNADSIKMYKNDRFIKEYGKEHSPYTNLKHGPVLVDDFIGNALEENEKFKPAQAKAVKEALNLTARYGLSHLPKKVILMALKLMVLYKMKPAQAVSLYHKYIGDWGGSAKVYRFEAIKDGKVVATVTKDAMTRVRLKVTVSNNKLIEKDTYDVGAIRIVAQDENGNNLPFFNEPVFAECEGPIEIIGKNVMSLKGGMGGFYVRTVGKPGTAGIVLKTAQTEDVTIKFDISIDEVKSL